MPREERMNAANASQGNGTKEDAGFAPWKDYRLHLTVLCIAIVSELIGIRKLRISANVAISFLPLVYAIIIGVIVYLAEPIRFVGKKQATNAETLMLIFIGPLLAKLAIASGQAIEEIISAGPALFLQEFGNLGTMLIALPIALLLGFKRESIGMTHSIGREQNVGLIIDKYGFASAEARGVLMIYIIGTMIGSIFIGGLASFLASVTGIHPLAYAMATGVGSAGMTAAAIAPLISNFPELESQIMAFSGVSNLMTQCTGIYMSLFIGLPLIEKLYQVLEPKLGRVTERGRNYSEEVGISTNFHDKETK